MSTPINLRKLLNISTLLFAFANTAFTLYYAIRTSLAQRYICPIAVAAAVLDVVSCINLSLLVYDQTNGASKNQRLATQSRYGLMLLVAFTVLLTPSVALTLATFIWIQLHGQTSSDMSNGSGSSAIKACFAIWGLTFISQSAFALISFQANDQSHFAHSRHGGPLPPSLLKAPMSVMTKESSLASFRPDSRTTAQSLVAESSQRSSLSKASRPESPPSDCSPTSPVHMSSSPLSTNSMEFQSSASPESARGERGWSEFGSARSRHETKPTTRLAPIPGSRPDSPANPLNGPFLTSSPQTETPSAASSRPATAASVDSNISVDESRIAPRFRSKPTRTIPSPPVIDESHIHPLFRSDSPLPPPTPTLGTTVTASAFGGQTLTARSLSRASTRSRSRSPVPSVTPGGRSRAGSLNSIHGRPGRPGQPAILRSVSLETVQAKRPRPGNTSRRIPSMPELPSNAEQPAQATGTNRPVGRYLSGADHD